MDYLVTSEIESMKSHIYCFVNICGLECIKLVCGVNKKK